MMSRRRLVGGDLVGGRYRVLGRLGGGGPAGEVYAARDTALGLDVALKIHRSEGLWSAPARRFWRGAVLSQEVSHPNVCSVHELGEENERLAPFLFATMDLIGGETLRARLRQSGALPVAEVISLGRQLAEGLAAIHRAGILHRDVKSDNVVVDRGHAVIVDFGLAREVEPEPSDITATGVLCGTPAYMAPEQAHGLAATTASDVYALGAVLYEMVTGVTPYAAESSNQVILLKQTGEPFPDPRQRRPDMPAELDAIIRRCLAADPAERYRADELAAALGDGVPLCRLIARARRDRRRLDLRALCGIVDQACAALHQRRHGDVRAENLVLGADGRVRLIGGLVGTRRGDLQALVALFEQAATAHQSDPVLRVPAALLVVILRGHGGLRPFPDLAAFAGAMRQAMRGHGGPMSPASLARWLARSPVDDDITTSMRRAAS